MSQLFSGKDTPISYDHCPNNSSHSLKESFHHRKKLCPTILSTPNYREYQMAHSHNAAYQKS